MQRLRAGWRWGRRSVGVGLLLVVFLRGVRLMEELNLQLFRVSLPGHPLPPLQPVLVRFAGWWVFLLLLAYGATWLLFAGSRSPLPQEPDDEGAGE